MKLDYGTQISPIPITLSIGTLRKPTLREIAELTFDKFEYYKFFIKMTPEIFYTTVKEDGGKEYWESLTEESRTNVSLYDIITNDSKLRDIYLEIFNFFFIENIIYEEGFFVFLKQGNIKTESLDTDKLEDKIQGVLSKETFSQVLELIQQICCIYDGDEDVDSIKFKNNVAKELYEKMLKAKKEKKKKADVNLTISNIISAVSSRHPSLNYINIWDLTVFQLLDSFNRLQMNSVFSIDSTRVSVWGDEKKTFDSSLWYKNNYDNG